MIPDSKYGGSSKVSCNILDRLRSDSSASISNVNVKIKTLTQLKAETKNISDRSQNGVTKCRYRRYCILDPPVRERTSRVNHLV